MGFKPQFKTWKFSVVFLSMQNTRMILKKTIKKGMADINPTSSVSSAGNQAPAAQEQGNLIYNSDCVVYIFFGRDQRDPQSISDIWIRMTRRDLDSPEAFRRALTQYIQSAIDLGMTHYYTYFGDVLMYVKRTSPNCNGYFPLMHTAKIPHLLAARGRTQAPSHPAHRAYKRRANLLTSPRGRKPRSLSHEPHRTQLGGRKSFRGALSTNPDP